MDVAQVIDAEGDAVQAQVAFQQESVDGLVVLIRPADDERMCADRLPTDLQDTGGL